MISEFKRKVNQARVMGPNGEVLSLKAMSEVLRDTSKSMFHHRLAGKYDPKPEQLEILNGILDGSWVIVEVDEELRNAGKYGGTMSIKKYAAEKAPNQG